MMWHPRPNQQRRDRRARCNRRRRGFNLVEMQIALAITAALMTATMFALRASFDAYQKTTEVASTHTVGRLTMHRLLALIRTGTDFGPFPINPNDSIVHSSFIEFATPGGTVMAVEFVEDDDLGGVLIVTTNPGEANEQSNILLEGVVPQYDEDGDLIPPFTLEFLKGRRLYRATVDLTIQPDDNQSTMIDGENVDAIRLVASAMPRTITF